MNTSEHTEGITRVISPSFREPVSRWARDDGDDGARPSQPRLGRGLSEALDGSWAADGGRDGRGERRPQLHKSTADDLSDCVAETSSETVDDVARHLVRAVLHTAAGSRGAGHDLREVYSRALPLWRRVVVA